jgi:pimeloyl-ACP methyl ester carboxylesterase
MTRAAKSGRSIEPTTTTLRVNGVNLNVTTAGKGDPVLLLHGFPDSAELWRHVIPRLVAAGHRVIAPDQRGFGRSDAPRGARNYTVEQIGRDAMAVLDLLGVKRAKLVGHDWGALIGWHLAGAYSHRFERYAALSVGHINAYASAGLRQKLKGWYVLAFQVPGLAEALFGGADFAVLRAYLGKHPELAKWTADLARPGRLTAGLNWYRANFGRLLAPDFPRASIPVMGVWSDRDVALAEDQMVNSARFVDAPFRYERLAGVGHWMPLDAPEAVSDLLLDFFKG